MASVATQRDADAVAAMTAAAFNDDPTWAWVFTDAEMRVAHMTVWWGLLVQGALPHGWVWMTERCTAASVWIPPGCPELSEEQEAAVAPMLREMLGERAEVALEVLDLFHSSHPRDVPHYYLSLLGTDPRHRGQGLGLGLLAENLELVDAERMPAYLEASNGANVALYERYGFERTGEFKLPADGPTVATMWREPRAAKGCTGSGR